MPAAKIKALTVLKHLLVDPNGAHGKLCHSRLVHKLSKCCAKIRPMLWVTVTCQRHDVEQQHELFTLSLIL